MGFLHTRLFRFSASHAVGDRHLGHNYVLGVTVEGVRRASDEELLAGGVEEALIRKLDSKDLGLHVDFLKNVPLEDESLLRTFWGILEARLAPLKIRRLTLERDSRTSCSLET